MIKILLPFIFILTFISCEKSEKPSEYFGQEYPDSIPVVFAPNVISMQGRLEHGLSFSPDARELAFGILDKDDFNGTIYYSKNVNDNWSEPEVFEPLKDKSVYLPYFSPDGKLLLFAQSKPDVDNGYTDIWFIEKVNNNWSSSKIRKSPFSSDSREANASMTYDGTIFFSSNRNCAGKDNCHSADLFYSKLKSNDYYNVSVIEEFISSNDEESVFISPKDDYIMFCRYTDDKTWMDLYISFRNVNNKWIEPQIIDSTINSKDWDRRPFVSIDNKFLFFTRLQIGDKGLTESDIYWVNTSKLFKPFVYNPLSGTTIRLGEKIEISIPVDYFKDIDDEEVKLSVDYNELDWIEFDSKQMKLTGLPTEKGEFELTFTATDKYFNQAEDKVIIKVVQ